MKKFLISLLCTAIVVTSIPAMAFAGEKPTTEAESIATEVMEVTEVILSAPQTILEGETCQVTATVNPEEATDKALTWTSSDTTIAEVDETGNVTGISEGIVTITAESSNGVSGSCEIAVEKTVLTLSKPIIKVNCINTTSCKLSWNKVDNASDYYVYRATSKNGKYTQLKKLSGNSALSYKNTGLKPGKTYYYKVKAYDKKGTYHSVYSSIITYKALPKIPELSSSAAVTASSVKLSWNKVSDASGYVIYKRSSSSASWVKIATIKSGKTTSYTYKKAKGNYYYSIKSYRTISKTKYYSNRSLPKRIRVLTKPVVSVNRYSSSSLYKAKVKWHSVTGATEYQLYVKQGENGTYKKVSTVKGTSYTYTAPSHGIYYFYKVRPIYRYNGTTSYGAYSKAEGFKLCHKPSYEHYILSRTDPNTSTFVMVIVNNGDRTMRIYSRTARLSDRDYKEYNRNLYLYNTKIFENQGRLVKASYTDIKPGEEATILLGCDKRTWYDRYSTIWLNVRYEGEYYDISFSDYYGSHYYKR